MAALLGSGTLITSVKAMTDLEVLAIRRLRLRELCSAVPRLGMRTYEAVADVGCMGYWRTLYTFSNNGTVVEGGKPESVEVV